VDLTGQLSNLREEVERLRHALGALPANRGVRTSRRPARPKLQVQHWLHPDEISDLLTAYESGATINALVTRFQVH
jgi:hypothetical protein